MEKISTSHGTFWREGDWMFVENAGRIHSIKVYDNSEFVYKLQKTRILARGGAEGLYKWMKTEIEEYFAVCLVHKICDWIFYRKSELCE